MCSSVIDFLCPHPVQTMIMMMMMIMLKPEQKGSHKVKGGGKLAWIKRIA